MIARRPRAAANRTKTAAAWPPFSFLRWRRKGQGAPAMSVSIFHWRVLFALIGGAAGVVAPVACLASRRK